MNVAAKCEEVVYPSSFHFSQSKRNIPWYGLCIENKKKRQLKFISC